MVQILMPCSLANFFSFRHACHGAVVVHDLADHAGRLEPGQSRQVHRTLGLAGANQYTARFGPEREDMAGADQVSG